ncbi:conserved hypothetical protein [Microsporum canis CBS 113480]|uniref:Altered inheritance of mitochondria protein 19 n=1 Tax=Arthroderma otae (strain ATCC MYA-4605 / CBS 113480) TaxID=554155 RepID=C5FEZ4_ARTOC|nr:conserved hypothetical protein [Microsporum canis CBS 113480]EEQ28288.1 conserved hypothetical protein [Microsporum canis CBS 113480]
MARELETSTSAKPKLSLAQYARAWGESPFPPTLLATFVTALHFRPFQPLPMLFPPVLLLTSYMNLAGFKKDSAGANAAWSGLYVLLAGRRKQALKKKWSARGMVRGVAMGVGLANLISGGMVYVLGTREDEES